MLIDECAARRWAEAHPDALAKEVDDAYASGPGVETTPEKFGEYLRGVIDRCRSRRSA